MLSSVVDFFTPGGRRRSAEADHVDQGVAQENDAVQDVAGVDDAAVNLAPVALFSKEPDEKHVDIKVQSDGDSSDESESFVRRLHARRRKKNDGQARKQL